MKSQIAKESGMRNPAQDVVNQFSTAASSSTSACQARSSFDDLHARIATRAYELYVQRNCREGCAVEDWLDPNGKL